MGYCHHHHATCRHDALANAREHCDAQSLRLTPLRKRVLELVWKRQKPAKAYDILAELQQEMPSAKPPTVYRALDFLLEQKLIHKLQRLNAFIGCHYPQEGGTGCYFLICSRCGDTQEMQHEPLRRSLQDSLRQQQFLPQQVTLEIEGLCRHCLGGN